MMLALLLVRVGAVPLACTLIPAPKPLMPRLRHHASDLAMYVNKMSLIRSNDALTRHLELPTALPEADLHVNYEVHPYSTKIRLINVLGFGSRGVVYDAIMTRGLKFGGKMFHNFIVKIARNEDANVYLAREWANLFELNDVAGVPRVIAAHQLISGEAGNRKSRVMLLMRKLIGVPLSNMCIQTPFFPNIDILRFAIGLIRTLHRVHLRGIIHKDIKPANVLVDNGMQVFLIDMDGSSYSPVYTPSRRFDSAAGTWAKDSTAADDYWGVLLTLLKMSNFPLALRVQTGDSHKQRFARMVAFDKMLRSSLEEKYGPDDNWRLELLDTIYDMVNPELPERLLEGDPYFMWMPILVTALRRERGEPAVALGPSSFVVGHDT